jgi:hypothetical protein
VNDEARPGRRQEWAEGPSRGVTGASWLGLSDDELLFKIEALEPRHGMDEYLVKIVQSDRHFFIRQEAAKKIRDPELLKAHSGDRHIGQILVRGMTRNEDFVYLEKLVTESRHLEVRKAAEAQLRALRRRFGPLGRPAIQ